MKFSHLNGVNKGHYTGIYKNNTRFKIWGLQKEKYLYSQARLYLRELH